MENFDQSGSRNNSSKDGPASPPQIVNAAIGHEAIKTTSSATKAQGKSTPRITLGDQALELREQSFKLLSDYSILRGEFLTSANEPNNPNTTAFEQAGLTDNYLAQVKFQAKLERLYRKIIGIVASKEEPIPGNVVGRKLAEMKESFEKDVTRMKALRSTLEAANKGNNGVYKYKAGVRYQLIGEEKPDVMPKRKPAVERKKRASNVVEEGDDLSVRRSKSSSCKVFLSPSIETAKEPQQPFGRELTRKRCNATFCEEEQKGCCCFKSIANHTFSQP